MTVNFPAVTEERMLAQIEKTQTMKLGKKTTIVLATLKNGMELLEASHCVDPKAYNEVIGRQICLERIKNRIYQMLAFQAHDPAHQNGGNGVKAALTDLEDDDDEPVKKPKKKRRRRVKDDIPSDDSVDDDWEAFE